MEDKWPKFYNNLRILTIQLNLRVIVQFTGMEDKWQKFYNSLRILATQLNLRVIVQFIK